MDSYREHSSDFELPGSAETPADDVSVAIGTDERRMHVRAYNYWVSLLDGRDFPSIEDLEPAEVSDFADHSVLVDFTCGRDNPALPYIGTGIRDECGLSDDTRTIADVPSRSLLSRLTDHYMQIIANRAPIGFEAEFANQRSETICYRGILMPFSSDGETIDFIYGVINWKLVGSAADMSDDEDDVAAELPTIEFVQTVEQDEMLDVVELAEAAEVASPVQPEEVADDAAPLELQDIAEDTDALELDQVYGNAQVPFELEEVADEAVDFSATLPETAVEVTEEVGSEPLELTDEFVDDEFVDDGMKLIPEVTEDRPDASFAGTDESVELGPFSEPDAAAPHFSWEDGPLADAEAGDLPLIELDENAGLADRLWAARETADAVKAGEGRTRVALYRALSLAYDFALAAQENPEEYSELLEESGVKAQARAPMTPIVKLVFGIDYDKARLTEFAAALSYALRQDVGLGEFQNYIEKQSGGLKALVAAERQARRPEPKLDSKVEVARARLRSAPAISLADVPAEEEFAVVVTRRGADGTHEPVAIVEDEALVERAIRRVA